MRKKALKKLCESLREKNDFLHDRIGGLEKQLDLANSGISKFCKDLDAEKKKYTELLEKYIDMMEKTARINEQAVETAPDEMVMFILEDVEALLLKWQQDNAYDYQLDDGFSKIKKKYMGGLRK